VNKLERVAAVLEGRRSDRPPVSFWYHFSSDCASGPRALDAHVRHVEAYDLDFLKIMDDNRYPRPTQAGGVVAEVSDLDRLPVWRGDEDSFGRQLELVAALAQRFRGQLRMATTVFNAWGTLRLMTVPAAASYGPPSIGHTVDARDLAMSRFLHESPQGNFSRHCLAAGADGIYLSVRDDWVDTPENGAGAYDRWVRPTDLQILEGAAQGTFNILHVCGQAVDFPRFAGYPVQVLSWADRYAGPSIAEVAPWARPALCAGLDNLGTLATGSPEDCARQVADAVRQAGTRPILIGPGCTFDPHTVPVENLHAVRRAVEDVDIACG
jgi:uroporphyrinogen decarboxylase